jgi:outer membrane receptor protein involved in Fe transport
MGAYGNPQLKPERGEELELGFDASLLGGRVGVEFTSFRKRVKDAIVNSPLPPSSGFTGSQIVNIGLIHTGGNELGVNAAIVQGGRFAWDLDTQLATFTNEIESLGPDLDVIFAGTQSQHRVGYSIADLFMRRVLTARINDLGQAEGECDGGTGPDGLQPGGEPVPCATAPQLFLGHSQPRWQVGVGNTFTFFNNLSLYARVEGNGGHKQVNTEIRATHNQATTEGVLLNEPMLQAYRRYENDRTGVYEAGFLRLREVSANYTLPRGMAQRLFAKRAQVSVGFRNLMMLWTAQHGWDTYRDGRVIEPLANMITWDPEVRATGDNSVGYQTVLPPTASATMSLRLSF